MSDGPHEAILEGAFAHLCLYLADGECHTDLYSDSGVHESVEALAQAVGEAAYSAVIQFYKELADANFGQSSEQRIH